MAVYVCTEEAMLSFHSSILYPFMKVLLPIHRKDACHGQRTQSFSPHPLGRQ